MTNATVPALTEGMTYFFAATASNASGLESDPSNEVSYSVPTTATNQPPTLDPVGDLTINENAGLQTVNLSGITSGGTNETQTLIVTATSNNQGLVPNPTVNYASPNSNGSLGFTPAINAFGTTVITVTVNDDQLQNNTVTRSFSVTVNAVNQPPTLDPLGNSTINENAGPQTIMLSGISSGATNEIQALTISATSGNPNLVPNPTVKLYQPQYHWELDLHASARCRGPIADGDSHICIPGLLDGVSVTMRLLSLPPKTTPGSDRADLVGWNELYSHGCPRCRTGICRMEWKHRFPRDEPDICSDFEPQSGCQLHSESTRDCQRHL